MELVFLFTSAFVVGFSGAMMPGPVLTATISEVLKRGWRAGPLIVLGHAIIELAILLAVIFGLGAWLTHTTVMGILGLAGGFILALMGAQMALGAKQAAQQAAAARDHIEPVTHGPILTGILTSLSNPYFPLWWATVGLNYAALSLERGLPGLASFYCGHILSDLTWYTLVALAVASGRRFMPPKVHAALIILCGIILVGLGTFFAAGGAGMLTGR
ncbi:MAG: lysine transporter LysE [Spartobacteria bacterium]|nr:lysine transporter LysE [Spartobacteria bacterium]